MNYTLQRMTPCDATETAEWMVRQYGFERHDVESWIRNLHFDWHLSVKALDGQGNTIGLLNMSSYRIEEETSQIVTDRPVLLQQLNTMRYTSIFSFIVEPQYRGTHLNLDMISNILPEVRQRFDFVFIPVLHWLATHQYWKRWGAVEFYRDSECVYYALPLSPQAVTFFKELCQ